MRCKCDYAFEWQDGPEPGYTVLRRLNYTTGAVMQNVDHGAALYCVAANASYVVAGGAVAPDGHSFRVRFMNGQCPWEPSTLYGSAVRSVAIDSSSNVYVMQEKPDTLILTTTNVGGSGSNETKTLTYGPQIPSGTFRLIYGNWTTDLDWDSTAAEIETALEALPTIGSGNVSCSGGPLNSASITIEFVNSLADTEITGFGLEQIDLGSQPTIIKYNSSGVFQWGYSGTWPLIGDNFATYNQLAVDSSGNVFFGHAPRGYYPDYGCLTKLNSSGVHQWTLPAAPTIGIDSSAGSDFVWSLDVDTDGDVYAGGEFGRTTETFELELTGAPTGGTFTLTVDSQTTAAIAYNADYAAIKSALEALSNVDLVTVQERPSDNSDLITYPFNTDFGQLPSALLVSLYTLTSFPSIPIFTSYSSITGTSSLTGGSSPDVSIRKISGGDDIDINGGSFFGLTKLDTDGAVIWHEPSGGFNAVAIDTSDNSVYASMQDDLELRDTDGTSQWTDTDPYGSITRIAPATSGDYFVAGGRLTKYNSSQVEQWATAGTSGGVFDCAFDGTHVWMIGNRVTVQTDP